MKTIATSGVERKGRGLGYFGDDKDRIKKALDDKQF
jgi:hypothetical protein